MRPAALIAALFLAGPACRRAAGPPDSGAPRLPSIAVTAERTDLLFSFVGPDGKFHDVTRLGEIPTDRRKQVLVRDLSKRPDEIEADRYVFIADLSLARDGGYPVAVVSRYGFDRALRDRVAAGEFDAPVDEGADGAVAPGIVLYSTSWCGACAAAREYFRERRVKFVEKDIEKDPKAQAELLRKARRAGIAVNGVPVIDFAGTLVLGFDRARIDQLLKGV